MNGANKLLLPVENKSLIQRAYDQLCHSEASEIIVVTGRDEEKVREQLTLREHDQFVHNPAYESGMTSSIQKGVKAASGTGLMICLGDMAWLNKEHYDALISQFEIEISKNKNVILLPEANGKRGNPVIFSTVYKAEILLHKVPEGCKQIIKKHQASLSKFITEDDAYTRDIDTQKDYDQLKGWH
jgi:molybdenum cofactor cytidylyltransferase